MPKFRVRKVSVFGYQNKDYAPGDIVELPESYSGLDFLEPIVEEPKETEKPKRRQTVGA
jgi:hypothetical protein